MKRVAFGVVMFVLGAAAVSVAKPELVPLRNPPACDKVAAVESATNAEMARALGVYKAAELGGPAMKHAIDDMQKAIRAMAHAEALRVSAGCR